MVHQTTCVSLEATDFFRAQGPAGEGHDFTISNVWSIAQWIKGLDSSDFPTEVSASTTENRILMVIHTGPSGGDVDLQLRDSGGELFYDAVYTPSSALMSNEWNHVVLTWDGFRNEITLFVNGVSAPATTINTNLLPTFMTSNLRKIVIGGTSGASTNKYFSTAIWDVALNGFDVTSLYNGGNGYIVDLLASSGTYSKANHLRHWWRHGFEPGNIGKDFGTNYNLIDIMSESSGIDASNVVIDYPGL